MKLQIQSVHFDADQKLLAFAQAKLDKLERFDESIISGDVTMSLDKDNDKGNKVVNVRLHGGGELFAERRAGSFEQAIDECTEALKRQIEKNKK
ncbi:MAG: ribosome-associated translation inhibitor RaiA [Rikenellaceae bacterium]